MVMRVGFSSTHWSGGILLWIIFSFWAVLTVSILCLMEGLSAFLHTLRFITSVKMQTIEIMFKTMYPYSSLLPGFTG